MSVAGKVLASLVDSPEGLSDFIKTGLTAELFKGPEETQAWELTHTFVTTYGALPSRTFYTENGINLPIDHPEPVAYYADQLRARHAHQVLKQGILSSNQSLNEDNPDAALQVLEETVLSIKKIKFKRRLVNFATEGKDIVFEQMKAKKLAGNNNGIKTGWPTFDSMADGLMGGDIITIVGRPGDGKTYAMLKVASHAWKYQDKKIAFFSMEMKPLPLVQRLAAMNAHKPITALKKGELTTAMEKDLYAQMTAYEAMNDFYIIDGALTATVDDITLMCYELNPDMVWVDGAYLVKTDNSRQQRWDRSTDVLEALKANVAERMNIPMALSFQFNRDQKKGMKKDLANIGTTDAVGQISSVVLGMGLGDNEQSVESINKRQIDIIKGRNGETGHFDINWNFDQGPNYMDFSEIKTIGHSDMVYGVD